MDHSRINKRNKVISPTMSSRRTPRRTIEKKQQRPQRYQVVVIVIFVSLLCLFGFILVSGVLSRVNESPAYAYARQTQTAMSIEPTPTPFQPEGSTAVAGTTPEPDSETSTPSMTSTVKVYQKPEGQVNVLLLGSDVRPDDGGFRTDVIVWVSLNPKDGYVSAISFPRDLFVQIPGYGENRINTAFPRGGFDLLADTFEVNFGIRPDHYVMVDFNGFVSVINSLGGINVQAAQNLTDTCAVWVNPEGMCSVGPGLIHMDGDLALWYVRSRYSTSDIDRARRAQEVIKAIYDRLVSLDALLMAADIYDVYSTYVQTDIGLGDVLPLLPLASKINDNGDIRNYVIGYDHAYDWVTYQGAQVLVPLYDEIQALLVEALSLK